jgi:hypothetical protein
LTTVRHLFPATVSARRCTVSNRRARDGTNSAKGLPRRISDDLLPAWPCGLINDGLVEVY